MKKKQQKVQIILILIGLLLIVMTYFYYPYINKEKLSDDQLADESLEKALDDDVVFGAFGVEVHVNKNSAARLMGSEIDYIDGLNGSGFKISNPNAKGSCGCGKSQSY